MGHIMGPCHGSGGPLLQRDWPQLLKILFLTCGWPLIRRHDQPELETQSRRLTDRLMGIGDAPFSPDVSIIVSCLML